MSTLFTASNVCKRYGTVTVLDGVRLDVREGEIHALVGANGAGKTTLCKIISGLSQATAGEMTLMENRYRPASKQAAEAQGVEIVQQELNQISTLTVAENILLTRMPHFGGVIHTKELMAQSQIALDRFGLSDIKPDTTMGTLGVGRQQMVEIATALDRTCRLLILDEPTAALSAAETECLFIQLRKLQTQGIGIIYISHRLDEVSQMSDRVTVLRDGNYVGTHETASVNTEDLVRMMSGEETQDEQQFQSFATSKTALAVNNICGGCVDHVSFSVNHGERLGIAGLVGSGRTQLLRLLFGADVPVSGTVHVANDTPTIFTHPTQAAAAGIALVTEDRKQNGLLLSQSIRVNTTLSTLMRKFASFGILRRAKERRETDSMVAELETRCNDIEQTVETLSGGNQQKVAISKWLVRDPEIFLFDEPTRGIDVSARRRIYQLLESLTGAGKTIVIVSSDLDELMQTCDRIGVMSAGRWVADFKRPEWSADKIMQAAFSGYRQSEAVG